MNLSIKQARILLTQNLPKLINFIFMAGYECALNECKRTLLQAWANARQKGSKIQTISPAGNISEFPETVGGSGISKSNHLEARAVDIDLYKDGIYLGDTESHRSAGEYWESLHENFRWGGNYGDGGHYEVLLSETDN